MRGGRSCYPVWEIRAMGPLPPSAQHLMWSFSCSMCATTVLSENPGSLAEEWTCDCTYSNSPLRALISTYVLNVSQSKLPMLDTQVIKSSILSMVLLSGLPMVNRISRSCFTSIIWCQTLRFSCCVHRAFHTSLDVCRFSTILHSAQDMF